MEEFVENSFELESAIDELVLSIDSLSQLLQPNSRKGEQRTLGQSRIYIPDFGDLFNPINNPTSPISHEERMHKGLEQFNKDMEKRNYLITKVVPNVSTVIRNIHLSLIQKNLQSLRGESDVQQEMKLAEIHQLAIGRFLDQIPELKYASKGGGGTEAVWSEIFTLIKAHMKNTSLSPDKLYLSQELVNREVQRIENDIWNLVKSYMYTDTLIAYMERIVDEAPGYELSDNVLSALTKSNPFGSQSGSAQKEAEDYFQFILFRFM